MCWCNPLSRTPWCGKPGCVAPVQSMFYDRAYVGGTFDLFHVGHVEFFKRVRLVARAITVALNTDEYATRRWRRPVMTLAERIGVVAACRHVDAVLVNVGNEDSRPAVLHSGARVIVHGDDLMGDPLLVQMGLTREWLAQQRIALTYVPHTPGISTGDLLQRIRGEVIDEY
jgi:glycerol-3-phosphate cytidylyltransferase